jgi:hypothetical protein
MEGEEMTILEYVNKNKEWLFSGVGVAVIGYVAAHFWGRPNTKSQPAQSAVIIVQTSTQEAQQFNGTEQIDQGAPAHITKISTITLAEILTTLEKAPPLQKNEIAKNYNGLNVQWETKLWSAEKKADELVNLTLDFGPSDMHLVHCSVRLSDYRELGILPKGAPITVIGHIKEIGRQSATLDDVQLFFHSITTEVLSTNTNS